MGYWPNLEEPTTYNEKMQWLKLNSKNHPEYTKMVDKVEVKQYVANKIGEEYIIPTIGVWDSIDKINWELLPNKFVIKAAGDSGGIVICRDKTKLDIKKSSKKLKKLGKRDYWKQTKEYPYKGVLHRYIAEAYLEDEGHKKEIAMIKDILSDK